jgi:hypothetical protein
MKFFLIKIILFVFILFIPLGVFFYINKPFIAAKKSSNSYSFNEKIKWLPLPKKLDILAVGSSMTLNNLSSQTLVDCTENKSYLNLSSWGMSMKDIGDLFPICYELYNPQIIITVSNFQDFRPSRIEFDLEDISQEMKGQSTIFNKDLFLDKYYLNRTLDNKINYLNRKVYTSLKYDEYGGVPLANKDFNIFKKRYDEDFNFKKLNPIEYKYLREFSKRMRDQKVKYIFVQSPVREKNRTIEYKKNIETHLYNIETILINDGHIVLDYSELKLTDEYFVDFAHLNQKGAEIITKLICKEINFED